jgi:hypothetical protein
MKTVVILSDEGAKSHTKELEQLITLIGYRGEIKHLNYDDACFPLETTDKIFAVCPRKPVSSLPCVSDSIFKIVQIIPIHYLGIEERNFPCLLQGTMPLTISGDYFPCSTVDRLCNMLGVSNQLAADYMRLLFFRNKSLQKSLADTLVSILSDLRIARDTKAIPVLQYAQNLRQTTQETAEKLTSLLSSLSELEQQQIADILQGTSLGEYLEKNNREKTQEDVVTEIISFRL